MGFLALADISARLPDLLEGRVFSRCAQEHLVEKAVRLARRIGDAAPGGDPRLLPRDNAALHFIDDSVRDFAVNIHFLLLPIVGSNPNVVE